jgi:hypothetical protein
MDDVNAGTDHANINQVPLISINSNKTNDKTSKVISIGVTIMKISKAPTEQ